VVKTLLLVRENAMIEVYIILLIGGQKMLFPEYGKQNRDVILIMHGMMQDWHSLYRLLKPLEKQYHLIIPAMDGFYDGSNTFTSFSDQCRQIEEYIISHFNGEILGVYGLSQGAALMTELLARNNIQIQYAVLDGLYTAHQGRLAGMITYKMMRSAKRKGGTFPKIMNVAMKRMGLDEEDHRMFHALYWHASDESMKRSMMETYMFHLNPEIKNTKTEIYLLCGSKEPYAKKSNLIVKKYVPDCKEEIYEGLGHMQKLFFHTGDLCKRLTEIFTAGGM